jgi:murein DD-endopeptidase MepM/ murein hydrolase activator NlpD
MDESFVPRSGFGQIGQRAGAFLDRHLTPISIGVAVIGLALVVAGPVRSLLENGPDLTGGNAPIAAGQTGAGVDGGDGGTFLNQFHLDRQIVVYTTIPDRPRDQVITYTINPGDTLLGIADRFNLDPNTIFWANSDILGDSVHMIRPGVELFILPVNGVYHRADGEKTLQWIAEHYHASVEAIIASPYNELEGFGPEDVPNWGTRVVVPGGEREIVDWRPPIVETTDASTGQVVRSFMPGMGGSCRGGIAGGGGSGTWINPLPGSTFVRGFFPGHSGLDLAAPVGTPVLASDSGVVIFSGWVTADWGYGILVVLDHGNGWTSYYAHLSATSVGCGQSVARGAQVGAVGITGDTDGPHLHFEMRWNHTPDNPAMYMGF